MVRLCFSAICVAALASSALATQHDAFGKRETIENGSPLYDCHEACGEVILMAQEGSYCSNSNYSSDLSTCLKCAETCEIWQYYGTDVKYAAGNCSDSATPSSSSSASSCASLTSTSTATNMAATTTATGTTTGTSTTASTATSSTGAGSVIQQNMALVGAMGLLLWALTA
ncbi:uncharacterized protein N7484_005699 [Penicillium longicatenatum]|uniref:uncharacterized protein n=1 Tax=Penicillium longicatenatum TaxID=1561947 RepID=UPI002548E8E3|nr:uncharacterized protein N7484_005699 [Penicillium longicatenatum]KAJ5643192.1 hypothetical protein N7484_005699 [Penicillium longicatenatum]